MGTSVLRLSARPSQASLALLTRAGPGLVLRDPAGSWGGVRRGEDRPSLLGLAVPVPQQAGEPPLLKLPVWLMTPRVLIKAWPLINGVYGVNGVPQYRVWPGLISLTLLVSDRPVNQHRV